MAKKVNKSFRVSPDTAEYIEREAESRGVSETQVMRRLLRDGIRHQEYMENLEDVLEEIVSRIQSVDQSVDEVREGLESSRWL